MNKIFTLLIALVFSTTSATAQLTSRYDSASNTTIFKGSTERLTPDVFIIIEGLAAGKQTSVDIIQMIYVGRVRYLNPKLTFMVDDTLELTEHLETALRLPDVDVNRVSLRYVLSPETMRELIHGKRIRMKVEGNEWFAAPSFLSQSALVRLCVESPRCAPSMFRRQ